MAKKKLTRADHEARREMVRNAEHTRRLAEEILAELERREQAGDSARPPES
jgi:hypothetical protein